ncbi:unnamed protein product [Notodromas monacha]|uniref:Uncharacterized protein n=1 Tax=Notodromas monacha TaxID=399045 RepID=A0A7R9BS35_9CRUS|nr:unnamed protein product [Notodromas monacha]CAG0920656.1 unnamed protein product [Notodromas monacha]
MAESQILNIATLKTLPRRSSVDFLKADVVTIGPLKMLLDVPILCKRVELADESGKISLCFLGPSAKSFDEWFPEVKAGKFLEIRNV